MVDDMQFLFSEHRASSIGSACVLLNLNWCLSKQVAPLRQYWLHQTITYVLVPLVWQQQPGDLPALCCIWAFDKQQKAWIFCNILIQPRTENTGTYSILCISMSKHVGLRFMFVHSMTCISGRQARFPNSLQVHKKDAIVSPSGA